MSKTRSLQVALLCLLLGIALTGLACGSGDSETPPAAETPSASGAETPESAPEEARMAKDEIPDDFPSDLPVYPGSKAGSSLGIPGSAMLVTFESEDDAETITAHLETALDEAGWSVTNHGTGRLEATKDARKATYRVDRSDEGGSRIAVSISGS